MIFKRYFEVILKAEWITSTVLPNFCIATVMKKAPCPSSISTMLPVESVVSMRKSLLIFRHIGIYKLLIADCPHTEILFDNNISFVSHFCGHFKVEFDIECTLCSGRFSENLIVHT